MSAMGSVLSHTNPPTPLPPCGESWMVGDPGSPTPHLINEEAEIPETAVCGQGPPWSSSSHVKLELAFPMAPSYNQYAPKHPASGILVQHRIPRGTQQSWALVQLYDTPCRSSLSSSRIPKIRATNGCPPLTQATHEVVTGPHGGRLGQVALVHTRGWEGGKGSPKRVGRRLQAALTIPGCPVCTLGGQKLSQTTVSMSLRSGAFPEGRCYKNNPRRKALCRLNCCCL